VPLNKDKSGTGKKAEHTGVAATPPGLLAYSASANYATPWTLEIGLSAAAAVALI